MIFRFGNYVLESERYELRRGDTVVPAEPKVLEVLAYLLTHRERVVSKEELLARIWDGRFVSDAALSRAIHEVRRLLGETAADARWVKTVYGRGFSFVGEVTAEGGAETKPADEDRSHDRGSRRGALPAPLTPLVGRERELDEIDSLLTGTRLLTLTGAAGTGKTRLALAAAARASERFADGAVFVPLAEVAEPELLIGALALATGVTDAVGGSVLESAALHLRDKHLLLVVDNFEHLIAASSVIPGLLHACPRLVVLITSRFVLQVEGEQEYPVPPLALPEQGAEPASSLTAPAVVLFLSRARAVLPSFRPSEHELVEVVEICRRLDGLPLAIELAAARIKLFSPGELRRRLDERLDLLTSTSPALPDRHRGLEQAVAWSHDLLQAPERALFRCLSVFAGGFGLAAAEAVCGARLDGIVDLLAALVDKSLVERQPTVLQEARFGLLESTRDFARKRLREAGEEAPLRDAHARWMLGLARRSEEQLAGGDQMGWARRFDAEHGNLLAALDWARAGGDLMVGAATAAAAARYWSARGLYREGRRQLQALLDHPAAPTVDPSIQIDALTAHGMLCHLLCDFPAAEESLEKALTLLRQLGDRPRLANVLNHLGWVAVLRSQLELAETLSAEALALHRELADSRGVAVALNNLGWAAFYRGNFSRTEACFSESLAMRRAADDDRGAVFTLVNHAMLRLRQSGGHDELESWIAVARRLVDRLADPPLSSWVLAAEGALAARHGRTADGIAMLLEAIGKLRETGSADGVAWVLLFLGDAYEAAGDDGAARTRFEELLTIWEGVGTLWGVAEGLRSLARLARAAGDVGAAGELYRQSLRLSEQIGARAVAAACRAALAEFSD